MIRKHHKGREILILASQTVADQHPSREIPGAGTQSIEDKWPVDSRLSDQIVDKGQVIHHRRQIRDDFTERMSGLTVSLEVPHGLQPGPSPS